MNGSDPETVLASKALENTANNRGAQLLTTDSMEEALEYLGIPSQT